MTTPVVGDVHGDARGRAASRWYRGPFARVHPTFDRGHTRLMGGNHDV
jgi:hypothetical protein